MNTNVLALTFDEPMLAAVSFADILLQQTLKLADSNVKFLLTGGKLKSGSADGQMSLTVELSDADAKSIKLSAKLAADKASTHISFAEGFVKDMATTKIVQVKSDKGVLATLYTPDTTPTALSSFKLDFEKDMLTMTFSDVVTTSTLDVTEIVFQHAATGDVKKSYSLKTGSKTTSPDGYVVELKLSAADVLAIKKVSGLAVNTNGKATTYIRHNADMIDDVRKIDATAITDGNAKQASSFVADATIPTLVDFSIDMGSHTLVLTFSEAVDSTTLDVKKLIIQNKVTSPTAKVKLGGSASAPSFSADETQVTIILSTTDETLVRSKDTLATGAADTFLSFEGDTVRDFVGLKVAPTSKKAKKFTDDKTKPTLASFALDMDKRLIKLTFSEVAEMSTVDLSKMTLFGSASTDKFKLTGHTTRVQSGVVVTCGIKKEDFDLIAALTKVAAAEGTTFLALTDAAAQDKANNKIVEIKDSKAVKVAIKGYTKDAQKPTLDSFSLDMGKGQLVLTFSETVDGSSFLGSALTIQNIVDVTKAGAGGLGIALAKAKIDPVKFATELTVKLDISELNELKKQSTLAISKTSTFLVVDAGAFDDAAKNDITAIAKTKGLIATSFDEDKIAPTLDSFELNMNAGTLTLEFSETVDAKSLVAKELTLQIVVDSSKTVATGITLSGDVASKRQTTPSTQVVVNLVDGDLHAIKLRTDLGLKVDNTFLFASDKAITDMNKRPVTAIDTKKALKASKVTGDGTPPA
jgi:hypothetical protein